MERLKIMPLAVAFGAVWSLGVLFLGIAAAFGWGTGLVEPLASLYLGYGAGFLPAVIGAVWAFADGAIAGAVIAAIYNFAAGATRTGAA